MSHRDRTVCDHHHTAHLLIKSMRQYLKDEDCASAEDCLRDMEYSIDGMHDGAVSLERRCQAYRDAIESLGFKRNT